MTIPRSCNRIESTVSEIIDRSKRVQFSFDGTLVDAHPGDTVASALYASGTRIFSRSFKYHRPRGLLCVAGHCPNCLMNVDGTPNVRACVEPVRNGMEVRHQNAWPSLNRDALSVLNQLDSLMPVGFYYKTFHKPRFIWRVAAPLISRLAGLGVVDTEAASNVQYHHRNLHAEVAVIGGGISGMSAAINAAASGIRVVLIDDQPSLGGYFRGDPEGNSVITQLSGQINSCDNIEVLSVSTAFGLYEDNLIGIHTGDTLIKLRAKQVVIATGSYEIPLAFDSNDVPGVMLNTGAQRLIRLYGVKPGSRAIIATSNDYGYRGAIDLLESGVDIAAIIDSRPKATLIDSITNTLAANDVEILSSHVPARSKGNKQINGIVVAQLDGNKRTTLERYFQCDLVAMSGGFQPAAGLLYQSGATPKYDSTLRVMAPSNLPDGIHAVGGVVGDFELETLVEQGMLVGLAASSSVSSISISSKRDSVVQDNPVSHQAKSSDGVKEPYIAGVGAKEFVCFCEDVSAKDVSQAIEEGFEDVQTLKRYSTVTMGPCQGKMCSATFTALASALSGTNPDALGITTSRPPVQPVTLGSLAGQSHMPFKRTPIDRKHRALGANMVDMGQWQRPQSYEDPQIEAKAVRERVGIIDVSTLGKLDIHGIDAPTLMDKVYTHRFSDLRPGRIRYGILCRDDGTILDDGTVTRLSDNHYFVTTTTGNLDLIEQWLKWWTVDNDECVHITDVTSAYAAINVAGPKARDTLSKITDVDLSSSAFRYMSSVQGIVAGVDAMFMRIGFVGETGWELHFPSQYGEHVWDSLMQAGQEFGISPFGVEAQRILRLEKGHVIVNQDTDVVSTPLDSNLSWAVRFDKDDFVGKAGLLATDKRGIENRLVGFVMNDDMVPADGVPVMRGATPIGRVTSARLSPVLGKGFGLAWVPVNMAEDGTIVQIRIDGQLAIATIKKEPVYDSDGIRLRE